MTAIRMRMRGELLRGGRWLAWAFAISCAPLAAAAESDAGVTLEWLRVADLPDPLGRKGMFAGVSEGHVVLAGGSNFPVPQREGGAKRFHREIWVRPVEAAPTDAWRKVATELPNALGEGASVTTRAGVVCLGGHDGTSAVATAFLLTYEARTRDVRRVELPPLPMRAAGLAAEELEGRVYAAGGMGTREPLRGFWRLNVAAAVKEPALARWEALPPLRGAARQGAFLVAVRTAVGARLVFGGGIAGPARSQADYLRDVSVFDFSAMRWRRGATMPRGAIGGAAVALESGRMLLLGGSDGHDFERMRELGERYRLPTDVLLYDVVSDRWSTAGTMPLGLSAPAVVKLPTGWLVAGGEYAPALRTAQVQALTVVER